MRGSSGHVRVLVESFGEPGFLGNRGRGWAITGAGGLHRSNEVNGRGVRGERKDSRLEMENGGGVRGGAGGGNGLRKDFEDFGPVVRTEMIQRRAWGRGGGRHGGLRGGIRLAGRNKRGGGREGSGGVR